MTREDYLKNLILTQFGSIRKFSDSIGIPSSTITSMLSRGVGGTSVDTIIKVCKALKISVEELQNVEKDSITEPYTVAAHLDGEKLSKEEEEDLAKYIDFLLSRRKTNKT